MTVAASPPLDLAITDAVRDSYGFHEVRAQSVLRGGMFSRPVLLETDHGLFVLRTHKFRSSAPSFQFQAEAIESASRAGVLCSRVEPTTSGSWCLPSANGRRVMALHEFTEGSSYDWHTWNRRRGQSGFLHALGRHVAALHNALELADPGGDASMDASLPPIQFDKLHVQYAAWRRDIDDLRRATNTVSAGAREQFLTLSGRIDEHWQRLLAAGDRHRLGLLPRQIVHGDISPVNLVFDAHDRPAFIDWDCIHLGPRMYDALGDVLNRPPDDRPDWNRFSKAEVDEYVDGYATGLARPLAEIEMRLVTTFCLARQLEDLRQRLYSFPNLDSSQDALYARLIAMRVDMMDQIPVN